MHALKTVGRAWALLCLMGLVVACAPQPACKQIGSSGRSIASWAATAQIMAQRWIAGDVPAAYAQRTLTKGAQQIRRAAAKLAQAPADPVAEVASARYAKLTATLVRIDEAVGKDDRDDVARLSAGLPELQKQIEQLRGRCEARKRAQDR